MTIEQQAKELRDLASSSGYYAPLLAAADTIEKIPAIVDEAGKLVTAIKDLQAMTDEKRYVAERWIDSWCLKCGNMTTSPLYKNKEYILGDKICRITCRCGFRYDVFYFLQHLEFEKVSA